MILDTDLDNLTRILTQGLRKELEDKIRAELASVATAIVNEVAYDMANQLKGKLHSYKSLTDGQVRVSLVLNNVETDVK